MASFANISYRNIHQASRAGINIASHTLKKFALSNLFDNLRRATFTSQSISNRHMATETSQSLFDQKDTKTSDRKTKKHLIPAMKFYLEKKKKHDAFIAKERSEFELGKKHLANMMGMDYETMTQEDIDKAIEYLFPSGLYDPDARPKMKPPEEVRMVNY